MNALKKPKNLQLLGVLLGLLLTAGVLLSVLWTGDTQAAASPVKTDLVGTYEQNLTNLVSDTLDGIVPIQRTYTLNDSDMVAPAPNPDCFGSVQTPAEMAPILEQAAKLLDGQTTLFTTETEIMPGTTIQYYLDETIFVTAWKQILDGCVYTFSEIKIAHPSQFRRFLSDGKYGSGILHTTTEMSRSVNAVMASSADFYAYRSFGVVAYQGKVYRARGHLVDTCYIDDNGDLLFTRAQKITDQETAQKFVDDHNVRFSLSFGPLMIENGTYCVPHRYDLGEINDNYSRAALCQMDRLHYVVATANSEPPYYFMPTIEEFANVLYDMGIPTAYALDGGQTAAISVNHQLVNTVSYGAEREVSDIIYFATALPSSEQEG